MLTVRRVVAITAALAVVLSLTAFFHGREERRSFTAIFERAIQLFPGSPVRVVGVDVGQVLDVRNVPEGVAVEFSVDDPAVRLPGDVEAAIVPVSLLGERYVQLFPAYTGGPALPPESTIPLERTAVPAEPDELLRSLQDYLGALDPNTVSSFVTNAAELVEGTGEDLNSLIGHASSVLQTLSSKRDDLAAIIVEFDRLSRALSTRQEEIGRLIQTYNAVVGTLTSNRAALEGTVEGLSDASVELSSLLVEHRRPLGEDIRALTRTGRTVSRNIGALTETGHWANRLFTAASKAIDYDRDWLRLNNQGEELGALILMRLQERLMELCADLGLPVCSLPKYWAEEVPSLFCFSERCEPAKPPETTPEEQLTEAIAEVPELVESLLERAQELPCAQAGDPEACRKRKRALVACAKAGDPERCLERRAVRITCERSKEIESCLKDARSEELGQLVEGLLEETVGNPEAFGGAP